MNKRYLERRKFDKVKRASPEALINLRKMREGVFSPMSSSVWGPGERRGKREVPLRRH
jgi:hypothetical protein